MTLADTSTLRHGRLFWLALGTFAIGTEGFMIAGLLPGIATDLAVSIETAGQLVTVFALAHALTRRHRYASHALRFAVKRSLETVDQLRQRINRAAEAEEEGDVGAGTGGADWMFGTMRPRLGPLRHLVRNGG